jgi:hypothetical protein
MVKDRRIYGDSTREVGDHFPLSPPRIKISYGVIVEYEI